MKEQEARSIQMMALNAIRELNAIAALELDWTGDRSLQALWKALGAAIWQIDRDVLAVLYAEFPELNDLKDMDFKQFDHLFGE